MFLNKKALLLLAGITVIASYATGQKKQFTISEAATGITSSLAPKSVKQPSWQPGSNNFCQVVNGGNAWIRTNMVNGKPDTLLRLNTINTAAHLSLKTMPTIKWVDADYIYFVSDKHVIKGLFTAGECNLQSWTTLPDDAENVTVDKYHNLAYTSGNNLWLITPDGRNIAVTHDADKNIINGQAVHRNEFGIETGIFLSPMGNYLAYYRMDQTMVNDYPIINWNVVPAKANIIKYPMAGGTSHQVTLCVYNPATGKTTAIKTEGPKDQYLTCVTWSPDEKDIYIALLNRDQNHLWLNRYSAETGEKIKTLFEETNTKYVHPTHTLSFIPGHSDQFIWWSERDGFDHLYTYGTSGKLINKLTNGKWAVNEICGFNTKQREVIITAAKESPLEKHVYTVKLGNGNITRIDKGAGMHTPLANENGTYIFDVLQGPGVAKRSDVYSATGNLIKTILDSPNPLAAYDRPDIVNVTLKASDNSPLYGKLILPPGLDSTKKYPVIVYLYNGPNVQLVHNSFPESGNLWFEYMAQRGYVVFCMDGRGSFNRGIEFEQVTFRKLGDVEMEDQLQGVNYLKTLRFVDPNRMGVHGWSFGGFMTTSLMLRHPGIFKVAVAGGPVMDWRMYEVMYTERYMDTPDQNPEGYENSNLLTKVKNLKGKLLLIHGTDDNTVVWQHSINFLKKCVDENVQVDYFVYPGYEHNVRGKDRAHLMQKVSEYFDDYLKP